MIEASIPTAPAAPNPSLFFNIRNGKSDLAYYQMTRYLPEATKSKIEELGAQNQSYVAQVVKLVTATDVDWTSADIQKLMNDDETINYLLYALAHDQYHISAEAIMTYDMFYCAFKSLTKFTVEQVSINDCDLAPLLTDDFIDADTLRQQAWFVGYQRDLQALPSHLQQCLVFTSELPRGGWRFAQEPLDGEMLPCDALRKDQSLRLPFRAYRRKEDNRTVMVVPNITIIQSLFRHQFGQDAITLIANMGDPGEQGIIFQSMCHSHALAQYHPDAPFPTKADNIQCSLLGYKRHDLFHSYFRSFLTANQRNALLRLNQRVDDHIITDHKNLRQLIVDQLECQPTVKAMIISILTQFSYEGDQINMRDIRSFMSHQAMNNMDFDVSKATFLHYLQHTLMLLIELPKGLPKPELDFKPLINLLLNEMQSQDWQDEFGINIAPEDWQILLSEPMKQYGLHKDRSTAESESQNPADFGPPEDWNSLTKVFVDRLASFYAENICEIVPK